ncbi:glutaminyl-peptide cyclotransferase [Flavobacterium sp.]|uniref:glutaminyl-peptide cyclotransferase n=1 Tax=Flavobacterium sp. TaxID=239 RepID=UPI003753CCC6
MKKYNLLAFILLAITIMSCGDTKNYFSINESKLETQYNPSDLLLLSVINNENETIDSVVYAINNKKIGSSKNSGDFKFELKNQKLGYQNITASVFFNGKTEIDSTRVELVSNLKPKLLDYEIVNTYPHDIKAYTQGLEFFNDTLYEGTGNGAGNGTGIRGISSLRKTDYKTGKVYKKVELGEDYFGEGITILNNKVYQLTWLNNEGYVYNATTFEKVKTFQYFKKIEGWGLTNDGKNLYQSDGSEKIYKLNPNDLKEVDYINVYYLTDKVKQINELEWVEGKIYGNIYGKDAIAIINPLNGMVEGIVDLSKLEKLITKLPDTDVLNGIAYNKKTKTFFVTGKNWDKMFEITIK